jgi:tetratricopeptide (TPR) repeat protein
MRKIGIAVIIAALALAFCDAASAGGAATGVNPVISNCQNPKIDKDARIAACDSLIQSNLANGKMLGVFYAMRGQANLSKGDAAAAMQDYNEALNRFPDLPEALVNRARLFDAQGKLDLALADYDHALKVRPSDATALYDRCYERAEIHKDMDGAIADCSEAIRLQPNNTAFKLMRGRVYTTMDRCADAIADFDAVIAAKPSDSAAYRNRGICKSNAGDEAGAKADMDAAHSLEGKAASSPDR